MKTLCVSLSVILAASYAPAAMADFATRYDCVFTTSCSATSGGCEATKVRYGLKRSGAAWGVLDNFNGTNVDSVATETLEDVVSLRWRAGGVWNNELALTELVLATDGAAAMSSIGRNEGRLGATVLSGRCETSGGETR